MDEIEGDVLTMAGGHFTPAALTPEGFEAIRSRARANADAYLDVFERLFLGASFNPEWHSDVLVAVFLDHLRDVAPERVQALAAELLRRYDEALESPGPAPENAAFGAAPPSEDTNYRRRLSERRREVQHLLEEP